MAFNKYVLTDLLRNELGYNGVIRSDWGVIIGRHWGGDILSIKERYKKSVEAGIDQYGGERGTSLRINLGKGG
jgi:Beta-glucosidase-related glycosidases